MILNRAAFDTTIKCIGLRVPGPKIKQYLELLQKHNCVLDMPKIKSIVPCTRDKNDRLILINPDTIKTAEDLTAVILDDQFQLNGGGTTSTEKLNIEEVDVTLTYANYSMAEILKRLLPPPLEFSSFEIIGHIAHLNLRDDLHPFKHAIGQVILDKNPAIKTVITKIGTIQSQFRVFDMEVIAARDGDEREGSAMETSTKENECVFHLDFSKVYYNSRLGTEHERLVFQYFRNGKFDNYGGRGGVGAVVADITAGIGPFVIPALKSFSGTKLEKTKGKGFTGVPVQFAYANDLNPHSTRYLAINAKKNKIDLSRLEVSTLDAKQFIKSVVPRCYKNLVHQSRFVSHFVMNLPSLSLEFAEGFRGSYTALLEQSGVSETNIPMPLVHLHCFTNDMANPEEDIKTRLCKSLGVSTDNTKDWIKELYNVRKVAPNKEMYCVSFELPRQVAFEILPSDAKKPCLEEAADR